MTRYDVIRQMTDDELLSLLVWGRTFALDIRIPKCHEDCQDFSGGCAYKCPHDKKEQAARKYLEAEV